MKLLCQGKPMRNIHTVPLRKIAEKRLLEFMSHDRIAHFYAVYDILHLPKRTRTWIALVDDQVVGYLIEFDKKILYMRGSAEAATPLLTNSNVSTALFNIEPQHLNAVKRMFRISAPADKMTEGKITTFTPLKTSAKSFKPVKKHSVQELSKKDAQTLAGLLNTDVQTSLDLLNDYAFGAFKNGRLVSYAASPDVLEDLAIIRGVFTSSEERNKCYSKSVCSALIERLLGDGKDVFLYVSKDNAAALSVYKEIGFEPTGHVFLGFLGQRRNG
jgi:hypothetical protein